MAELLDAFVGPLAQAVHPSGAFLAITLGLVVVFAFDPRHRARLPLLGAAMLATFILSLGLKPILGVPRPCMMDVQSLVECPFDYAMPSAHAAVSFTLAVASVGLPAFPLYLAYAALVSASRLYLGVHGMNDVLAGFAISVLSVALVDGLKVGEGILLHGRRHGLREAAKRRAPAWGAQGMPWPLWKAIGLFYTAAPGKEELARKGAQAALGLGLIALALGLGSETAAQVVAWVVLCGLALFHLKALGRRLPLTDLFLERMERPSAPPGFGALTYFSGVLLSLAFLPGALGLAGVYVLSVCDTASTLFGKGARHRLIYNPRKSYLGTLAFFLSGLPLYFLAGWPGVAMAALAALLESLPLEVDDNLLLPWAGVAVHVLKIGG